MKAKRIIALVLVVALIASLCICFAGCNKDDGKKDKAIIYVTALFSGGLYNTATGEAVWEPIDAEIPISELMAGTVTLDEVLGPVLASEQDVLGMVVDALDYTPGTLLYDLTLDQDGNPLVPTVVTANGYPKDENGNIMDISYGVFGIYKPFVDNLSALYGDEYDVLVFNQDWRVSPALSGERLYNFIKEQGYNEVILMSHSMGGPVVNSYISYCNAHGYDNKVSLYMGYAPATLGSFDALAALTCIDAYLENMLAAGATEIDPTVEGMIDGVVDQILGGSDLGDFLFNNIGLMTLIPSYQFLASEQYKTGTSGLGIIKEGENTITYLTEKEEIYDFYKSLDWAFYKDEDGNKVKATGNQAADKDGWRLKEAAASLDTYYDSLFIDGKLACETVNSYYFVGEEIETAITSMVYNENTGKWKVLVADQAYVYENDEWVVKATGGVDNTNGVYGDGTVPIYSSIGGNTVSSAKFAEMVQSGKIIEFKGSNHGAVGGYYDLMKDDIIRLINSVAK